MEKIMELLENEIDETNTLIEDEIFSNLRMEREERALTQNEIIKINKYRKKIFFLYEAIRNLNNIK